MEPIDYLRAIRRRWRVILSCLILAVVAAWVTAPSTPQQARSSSSAFTATATLLQSPGADTTVAYLSLFVTSGDVPVEAAKRLGYDGNAQLLATQVVATPDATTGALKITANGTDGPRTATVANAFANSLIHYLTQQKQDRLTAQIATINKQLKDNRQTIQDLQAELEDKPNDSLLQAQKDALSAQYGVLFTQLQTAYGQQSTDPGISVLQSATPIPVASGGFSAPSSRFGRVRLGALAGLLLGALLALVLERFDTRLRTRAATQNAFRLPILAEIPRLARPVRHGHAIVTRTVPGGSAAEAYRALRSSLLLLPSRPIPVAGPIDPIEERPAADASPKVVLVVSARQGEGKTSTVVNVATAMAEAGKRVLVLDYDLRAPEAHLYLDVPNGSGMSELLESPEDQELLSLSRPTAVPGVRLVTGGRATDHSTALPSRMAQIISEARDLADIVLIDTTPILIANDAIDLMPTVDTVLVVARAGRTTQEQAERTVELLARMRVPVSGVALIGTGPGGMSFRITLGQTYSSGGTRRSNRTSRQRHKSDRQKSDQGAR